MTEPAADPHGLVALPPQAAALLHVLDSVFERWGVQDGANPMIMPPLLPVAALARLDVYENFPHQALVAGALDLERHRPGGRPETFAPTEVEPLALALPSAACFAVYLHHQDAVLGGDTMVTVMSRCFRREERWEGLRRMLGFHMREVVALGSAEFVTEHLRRFEERIVPFAAALGLDVRKIPAADPFYDRGGQRALLARLAPVKHEFVVGDLAIASVNVHRNFFGERCAITYGPTGHAAFSSCAAFGLERWLAVLHERHGGWEAAAAAVDAAAAAAVVAAGCA